jgi:hypothetical protein
MFFSIYSDSLKYIITFKIEQISGSAKVVYIKELESQSLTSDENVVVYITPMNVLSVGSNVNVIFHRRRRQKNPTTLLSGILSGIDGLGMKFINSYHKGKLNGVSQSWYSNGFVSSKINYKNGILKDIAEFFRHFTGKRYSKIIKLGKTVQLVKEWYDSGRIRCVYIEKLLPNAPYELFSVYLYYKRWKENGMVDFQSCKKKCISSSSHRPRFIQIY